MRRALTLIAFPASLVHIAFGGSTTTTDETAQAPASQAATPSAAQPHAPRPAAPRPPSPPKPRMVSVPAGTVLEMELQDPLSTTDNKAGDAFQAKLTDAVSIGGEEVIPAGSIVAGTVTRATSAKKMSGQAVLALQFTRLKLPDGHTV